jgi:hypothetical protein
MKNAHITVYPHNPADTEVEFSKGTVMFYGGSGYIANAVTDDGKFLGEAEGATEAEAVAALGRALVVGFAATDDAKPDQVQDARERIKATHDRRFGAKLEHVSDGELGHMVREAMQEQEVAKATESRDAALVDRAIVDAERERLRLAEAAERATWEPIPGYVAYGLTVPELDMRDKDMNAVADAKTIMLYSALSVLAGRNPLDREATTWGRIRLTHTLLTPDRAAVVPTAGQFAKAQTLAKVLHVSMDVAQARVLEMFPA